MSLPRPTADLSTTSSHLNALIDGHLEDTGGLLRLTPTWVPRSFLQPGLRIKLHPDDTYAYSLNCGGIDERFTLREAIAESGVAIVGKTLWDKHGKWPVYSKFGPEVNPDASAIVAYKN